MIILRRAGYTNKEVSDLAGEEWKESTVKFYTRGVVVSHWEEAPNIDPRIISHWQKKMGCKVKSLVGAQSFLSLLSLARGTCSPSGNVR